MRITECRIRTEREPHHRFAECALQLVDSAPSSDASSAGFWCFSYQNWHWNWDNFDEFRY